MNSFDMLLHQQILLIVRLVAFKVIVALASLFIVHQHGRNAIVEGVYNYSFHTHSKSINIKPCPEIVDN